MDDDKNQNQLIEQMHQIKAAVESTSEAILITDLDGNNTYLNVSFGYLFGVTSKDMDAFNVLDMLNVSDNALSSDAIRINLSFEGNFEGEVCVRSKNGKSIPCFLRLSGILDENFNETGVLWIFTDITELKKAQNERDKLIEELKIISLVDELTGLSNRRGFFNLAEHEIKRAQRQKAKMMMLFIDMDNMKNINDTLGHKEGDKALKDLSDILKNTFRRSDIIARLGGDEFVVLVSESDFTAQDAILNRLNKQIEQYNKKSRDSLWPIKISVGISEYDYTSSLSIDELIAEADKKMYEIKQNRKKQIKQTFSPE
ncbi:MAG: diguanylate cyclase with PAS/PAC sensor [uncultured bacterium]|nr:MAG: diguanylate cyclase with PAS/PAC sensor [uncultured bacterium]